MSPSSPHPPLPVPPDPDQGGPANDPSAAAWSMAGQLSSRDLANVRVADHDGISVAAITGEVDVSNVEAVGQVLTDLSNLALGLVVDLRGVEYLDSSGISLLHDLALRLRQRTQLLTIVCPPGSPPRRMLELTALDSQTVVLDDLGAAIEAVRAEFAPEED